MIGCCRAVEVQIHCAARFFENAWVQEKEDETSASRQEQSWPGYLGYYRNITLSLRIHLNIRRKIQSFGDCNHA